jgi:hypothetical protein
MIAAFTAKAGPDIAVRRRIATSWTRTMRLTKWLSWGASSVIDRFKASSEPVEGLRFARRHASAGLSPRVA